MGGSHSSLSASDSTSIVLNATQSNYASCWQPTSASNTFNVTGTGLNVNCPANQSNVVTLHSKCMATASSSSALQATVNNAIAQQLKSTEQQFTGWMSDQSADSTSNIDTVINTQIDQSSVQKCNQAISANNAINVSGKNDTVTCPTQSNVVNAVNSCILNSSSVQKTITNMTNTLNQHANTSEESFFQPFVTMFESVKDSIMMTILAIFLFFVILVGCLVAFAKLDV